MGRPVRQLQREIDSAEFAEWMAFYHLEPWGDQWNDYRFGVLAASLKNSWRGEGSEPYEPADFFRTLQPPPAVTAAAAEPDRAAERIRAAMEAVTKRMMNLGFKPADLPPPPAT